jgi:hypothetical protein
VIRRHTVTDGSNRSVVVLTGDRWDRRPGNPAVPIFEQAAERIVDQGCRCLVACDGQAGIEEISSSVSQSGSSSMPDRSLVRSSARASDLMLDSRR